MSDEKKSLWQTLPALIAGIATILTAVVALATLVLSNGGDRSPGSTDTPEPEATQPRAVVSPRNVDFGRVAIGRSGTQAVTVANAGGVALTVDDIAVSGRTEVFSADGDGCLGRLGIAAGSECQITVTFSPGSTGDVSGFLEIVHSGTGSPERVALSGQGALLGL